MNVATRDLWRRPGPTAEQQRIDLLIGVGLAVLATLNVTLASSVGMFLGDPPPSWPERLLWVIAVTLPLAGRRRWPELTTLVVSLAFIAGQVRAVPEHQLTTGALFAAIYTLGAWGRDHRRSRRLRVGIIAAMFVWLGIAWWLQVSRLTADAFPDAAGPMPPLLAAFVNSVLVNVLFFSFAYFFGETSWVAAYRAHQLQVQADELRHSQELARERAVMGERVRIAREMHDVVAHYVSVMGVQAAACRRVLEKDLAKAKSALSAVEESARTAMDELRRMLGLLRQSGGGAGEERPTAAAGVERVEGVLAGARDAGLTTEYGVYGEPVPLPESISQAAYRIAQEAVTNTLKHAGATSLDVRIRYLASQLEIDVVDDGRGGNASTGGGLGLIGMRERVAALGGELEVGPRTGGGFRVRARFPLARVPVGT